MSGQFHIKLATPGIAIGLRLPYPKNTVAPGIRAGAGAPCKIHPDDPMVSSCHKRRRKYRYPFRSGWTGRGWCEDMVWEKPIRQASWVCFVLMLVMLAVVIYSAAIETEEPPVTIILLLLFFGILFAFLQVASLIIDSIEKERIKKRGILATGTIISLADTGVMINDKPQLKIELDVQPPYEQLFRTSVVYVVPYSVLPQVQPGKKVQVFYLEGTREVALAEL